MLKVFPQPHVDEGYDSIIWYSAHYLYSRYPVKIKLANLGSEPLVNLSLALSCQDNDNIDVSEDSNVTNESSGSVAKFPLNRTVESIAINESYETVVYVRCTAVTVKLILVKVSVFLWIRRKYTSEHKIRNNQVLHRRTCCNYFCRWFQKCTYIWIDLIVICN